MNPHRGSDFNEFLIEENLMTPTPRTDAIAHRGLGSVAYIAEMTDFARQLERENHTFRAAQKACEDCDAPRVDRIAELERELAAEREQVAILRSDERRLTQFAKDYRLRADEAEDQLAANHEATKLMGKWLETERALADRLAALIKRDRDGYGGQVVDPECDCCDCEYLEPIDKALAAWKEARSGTV